MSNTQHPTGNRAGHDLASPDKDAASCSSSHPRSCSPDSPSSIRSRTTTSKP